MSGIAFRASFLLLILAVFGVGCGSYVFVSAQRDLDYQFRGAESIFVHIPDEISVQEKNFYNVLSRELKNLGYSLVARSDEARLVISLSVRKETVERPVYYSPYSYGFYDLHYRDFFWPRYPFNRYYPHRYKILEDKDTIELQLFEASQFNEGKRLPLWEGSVSGDEVDLQRHGPENFLRPLLVKIGESFRGSVKIPKN